MDGYSTAGPKFSGKSGPGGPIFLEFWSPGPKFSPDQNFRDTPSKLVKGSMYGFRTSFRTFDTLGCDLENVECLKRDVYYCNIYMYTCIFCVYLFITHVVTVYL